MSSIPEVHSYHIRLADAKSSDSERTNLQIRIDATTVSFLCTDHHFAEPHSDRGERAATIMCLEKYR